MRSSIFEVGTTYRDRAYHKVADTLNEMGIGTDGITFECLVEIIRSKTPRELIENVGCGYRKVPWSLRVLAIEEAFGVTVRQQGDMLWIGFDHGEDILVEDFTNGAYRSKDED